MTKELASIITHVFPGLRPGGGPYGYGFNLQRALQAYSKGAVPIRVLAPKLRAEEYNKTVVATSWRFNLVRKAPIWLAASLLLRRYQQISQNAFKYAGFSSDEVNQIRSSKIVVFHDFKLARTYFYQIGKQPNQLILMMPHSPTDLSAEIIENWKAYVGPSSIWQRVYKAMAEAEFQTLLCCDGLITPCVHSLSHYFVEDPKKREQLLRLPIYEIPSGVDEKRASRNRQEVLSSLGIPPENKVIGFFGRHHYHKGYDLFCHAARLAYKAGDEELFFLTAGSGPVSSPKGLPNFKDLGYLTAGLDDIIAAADLVVAPNRVNYFDLLILEALSLGKIILTTPIGGALCIQAPGIFFLRDLTPLALYKEARQLSADPLKLARIGAANREAYLKEYTLQRLAERHVQLGKTLLISGG